MYKFNYNRGEPFIPGRGKLTNWKAKMDDYKRAQENEIRKEMMKLFPQETSQRNNLVKRQPTNNENQEQERAPKRKVGPIYFGL